LGYFITEKEYENYYLHVVFKWGEHTYEPRKDKARDSGVLFYVQLNTTGSLTSADSKALRHGDQASIRA
jgi:hypothetical protein